MVYAIKENVIVLQAGLGKIARYQLVQKNATITENA
jgi:hypothetical protein